MTASAIATGLHALAAAVWVGGMFFAHMALRPSVMVLEPPPLRLKLWGQVFPRFFVWVWTAVALLWATGLYIIFNDFGGFGGADLPVHLMTGIAMVMTAIFALIYFVPFQAFRKALSAEDFPAAAAAQGRIRQLVATNLILGLATVAIGASGRLWG